MHLIIDIRQPYPADPTISRYASDWVDLWLLRHPTDTISYLHWDRENSPDNGRSIMVLHPSFWRRHIPIVKHGSTEIFRCVSFSPYPPYDQSITTISHHWDNGDLLFAHTDTNIAKNRIKKSHTIIVPSISIGEELVQLSHISENQIHPIPYIELQNHPSDRHLHVQISLDDPYWIYDGDYSNLTDIERLLMGYQDYLTLGGSYLLIFTGYMDPQQLRHISRIISEYDLTGSVRITGLLESWQLEALYQRGGGWLYTGSYYRWWPRIALARHYHIPLLLSRVSGISSYDTGVIYIHPNHPKDIGKSLISLESLEGETKDPWVNEEIMKIYEKLISTRG